MNCIKCDFPPLFQPDDWEFPHHGQHSWFLLSFQHHTSNKRTTCFRTIEMTFGSIKGGKMHNTIMHKVLLASQQAESFVYCWLRAHAMVNATCFSTFVRPSDVFSSILSISQLHKCHLLANFPILMLLFVVLVTRRTFFLHFQKQSGYLFFSIWCFFFQYEQNKVSQGILHVVQDMGSRWLECLAIFIKYVCYNK